jgi:hypothetical protein
MGPGVDVAAAAPAATVSGARASSAAVVGGAMGSSGADVEPGDSSPEAADGPASDGQAWVGLSDSARVDGAGVPVAAAALDRASSAGATASIGVAVPGSIG